MPFMETHSWENWYQEFDHDGGVNVSLQSLFFFYRRSV